MKTKLLLLCIPLLIGCKTVDGKRVADCEKVADLARITANIGTFATRDAYRPQLESARDALVKVQAGAATVKAARGAVAILPVKVAGVVNAALDFAEGTLCASEALAAITEGLSAGLSNVPAGSSGQDFSNAIEALRRHGVL